MTSYELLSCHSWDMAGVGLVDSLTSYFPYEHERMVYSSNGATTVYSCQSGYYDVHSDGVRS